MYLCYRYAHFIFIRKHYSRQIKTVSIVDEFIAAFQNYIPVMFICENIIENKFFNTKKKFEMFDYRLKKNVY